MIELSIIINASLERVWKSFTDKETWKQWWGGGLKDVLPGWETDAEMIWELGGSSRILECFPNQILQMEGSVATTTFYFQTEEDEKTEVRIEQSDPRIGFYNDGGLAQKESHRKSLEKLKKLIENETMTDNSLVEENFMESENRIEYCVSCGNPLGESTKFCAFCGKKVEQEQNASIEVQGQQFIAPAKRSRMRLVVITLSIVVLLAVSALVYYKGFMQVVSFTSDGKAKVSMESGEYVLKVSVEATNNNWIGKQKPDMGNMQLGYTISNTNKQTRTIKTYYQKPDSDSSDSFGNSIGPGKKETIQLKYKLGKTGAQKLYEVKTSSDDVFGLSYFKDLSKLQKSDFKQEIDNKAIEIPEFFSATIVSVEITPDYTDLSFFQNTSQKLHLITFSIMATNMTANKIVINIKENKDVNKKKLFDLKIKNKGTDSDANNGGIVYVTMGTDAENIFSLEPNTSKEIKLRFGTFEKGFSKMTADLLKDYPMVFVVNVAGNNSETEVPIGLEKIINKK